MRKVRALPKVKKVFIRSGIRYDYLMQDPRHYSVLKEIIEHHVSGQLKVGPEHVSPKVLAYMGKPRKEVYLKFKALYEKLNKEIDKKQFLVPYFISSHPVATFWKMRWLCQNFCGIISTGQSRYKTLSLLREAWLRRCIGRVLIL